MLPLKQQSQQGKNRRSSHAHVFHYNSIQLESNEAR